MFKVGDILQSKLYSELFLITDKSTTHFRLEIFYPTYHTRYSRLYFIKETTDLFTLYSSILRADDE